MFTFLNSRIVDSLIRVDRIFCCCFSCWKLRMVKNDFCFYLNFDLLLIRCFVRSINKASTLFNQKLNGFYDNYPDTLSFEWPIAICFLDQIFLFGFVFHSLATFFLIFFFFSFWNHQSNFNFRLIELPIFSSDLMLNSQLFLQNYRKSIDFYKIMMRKKIFKLIWAFQSHVNKIFLWYHIFFSFLFYCSSIHFVFKKKMISYFVIYHNFFRVLILLVNCFELT